MNEPWSKRHKSVFKGCQYSLSNSFAEPLSHTELIKYTTDKELLRLYNDHELTYVPNGGSIDLREDIARVVYDSKLSAENILVFPGGELNTTNGMQCLCSAFTTTFSFHIPRSSSNPNSIPSICSWMSFYSIHTWLSIDCRIAWMGTEQPRNHHDRASTGKWLENRPWYSTWCHPREYKVPDHQWAS